MMDFVIKTAEMGIDKDTGEIVGVQLVGALNKKEYEMLLAASQNWIVKLGIDNRK